MLPVLLLQVIALGSPQMVVLTNANQFQYVLPENSVVYAGCVGKDMLANTLREANQREGVASAYQVTTEENTGACAVILNGHNR